MYPGNRLIYNLFFPFDAFLFLCLLDKLVASKYPNMYRSEKLEGCFLSCDQLKCCRVIVNMQRGGPETPGGQRLLWLRWLRWLRWLFWMKLLWRIQLRAFCPWSCVAPTKPPWLLYFRKAWKLLVQDAAVWFRAGLRSVVCNHLTGATCLCSIYWLTWRAQAFGSPHNVRLELLVRVNWLIFLLGGSFFWQFMKGFSTSGFVSVVHVHLGGEGRRVVGIDFAPVAHEKCPTDNKEDEKD